MVRTRKSEAERDLDEIELATEKVSLASFFFFFPPLFQALVIPSPLPTSLFSSPVHKRICTHPSLAVFPEMCLYTRELVETRGSVKVRFLWMQFRPLYIYTPFHSNPPYDT